MKKEWEKRFIRAGVFLLFAVAVAHLFIVTAYAGGDTMVSSFKVESGEGNPLNDLMNNLFAIISAAGDVYLGYGAYKFGESFDSDESREQSKGISIIIAGFCLANLKTATDLFG